MAKYYYEKWSIVNYWDEVSANSTQSKLIIELTNWNDFSPISGLSYFPQPFSTDFEISVQNYPKYPIGNYQHFDRFRLFGVPKIGDIGYIKEGNTFYKGTVIQIGTPGINNSYVLDLTGLYSPKFNNRTIYNHIDKINLVDTIIAEEGAYPINGVYNNFWYVRTQLVFPELEIKINGQLKKSENGWVKINGVLREIDTITIKENGILKEV